jgi:hypothetical protein
MVNLHEPGSAQEHPRDHKDSTRLAALELDVARLNVRLMEHIAELESRVRRQDVEIAELRREHRSAVPPAPVEGEALLNIREVARELKVSTKSVYNAIDARKLPAARVNLGGASRRATLRVRRSDLVDFIQRMFVMTSV